MYQVNQRRRKSKDIWVILLGQTKWEKNIPYGWSIDNEKKTFGQQRILYDKSVERERERERAKETRW